MAKSVSAKMGIKQDAHAILIQAPADAIKAIDPPDLNLASRLIGDFEYIHFFARSQAGLKKKFPQLKSRLKPKGMLWISWPKAGQKKTDLTLIKIIKIGYDHGLVESKTLSVNQFWSAIKFTHPKKGKV